MPGRTGWRRGGGRLAARARLQPRPRGQHGVGQHGPAGNGEPAGPAGESLAAIVFGPAAAVPADALAAAGVSAAYAAESDRLTGYAPLAWARAIAELAGVSSATAVVAAATDHGNEVLAHLAAITGLPMAANCATAARAPGGTCRSSGTAGPAACWRMPCSTRRRRCSPWPSTPSRQLRRRCPPRSWCTPISPPWTRRTSRSAPPSRPSAAAGCRWPRRGWWSAAAAASAARRASARWRS